MNATALVAGAENPQREKWKYRELTTCCSANAEETHAFETAQRITPKR